MSSKSEREHTPRSGADTAGDTDPIRLKDAQRAIRDSYFQNESGLFTLNCVPGAGKSVVTHHIAAEAILRRYVAGDQTPEQAVAVISFSRREVESIIPAICDRLWEIVEHDLIPEAESLTEPERRSLLQRIRQAPYIGTIDAILRDVLADIAVAVGFASMPTVGNTARLEQVHDACYRELRAHEAAGPVLDRLSTAYPDGDYVDGVHDLLKAALTYCRTRGLSTVDFWAELERTVADVYAEGPPTTFEDVVTTIERLVGADMDPAGYDHLIADQRAAIVAADSTLHDAWQTSVTDFCTIFAAYREIYSRTIRDQGVVSYTDVAYLVNAYFAGDLDAPAGHRDRIIGRYHTRIASLIIDEAQDVSAIQHAALSHLITPDARVFAAGDLLQSIYLWRDADPTLFERAITTGAYLGVDWDIHDHRTATTTYRCRPAIAHAINAICEPALTDPERGDLGDLDVNYPGLDPAREAPSETARTTHGAAHTPSQVHVAAFDPPPSHPDSYHWISSPYGNNPGEAGTVATFVKQGLADGIFTDADGHPLGITVLFRWRSKMDAYATAFEDVGLRVRRASEKLFESAIIEPILAVCEWLLDPADPDRLRSLVTTPNLGLAGLEPVFEDCHWDLDVVSASCTAEQPTHDRLPQETDTENDSPAVECKSAHESLLEGLLTLRDRRGQIRTAPAAKYVGTIIEALELWRDPYDRFEADPGQRIAVLDTLIETVRDWEGDDHLSPQELVDLVTPFIEEPYRGPRVSSVATGCGTYDVEFRTVHDMKGDEDDVIVLANPGFDLWKMGAHAQRLITQGPIAGLAPPIASDNAAEVDADGTDASDPDANPDTAAGSWTIPPFDNGLYDPSDTRDRDVGLRWATTYWRDECTSTAGTNPDGSGLVGPDRLTRVAANNRAESWRLLYVALTRAREHLVVPLPRDTPIDGDRPRDRWLDTIREVLAFDADRSGCYTVSPPASDETVTVGVNDVDLTASRQSRTPISDSAATTASESPSKDASVWTRDELCPPRSDPGPWLPRFINPSTLYPLVEDVEGQVLNHLLGRPLDSAGNPVTEDLRLPFEQLPPDALGTCLHTLLTTLLEYWLSRNDAGADADPTVIVGHHSGLDLDAILDNHGTATDGGVTVGVERIDDPHSPGSIRQIFDAVIDSEAPSLDDAGREAIYDFFIDTILDQFLESTLWDLLQQATRVYIEVPIDGLIQIPADNPSPRIPPSASAGHETSPQSDASAESADQATSPQTDASASPTGDPHGGTGAHQHHPAEFETEVHGTPDVVLEMPDGHRHVADLKITLTEPSQSTQKRYKLQVTTYAELLDQQGRSVPPSHRWIETMGIHQQTINVRVPTEAVQTHLERLVQPEASIETPTIGDPYVSWEKDR